MAENDKDKAKAPTTGQPVPTGGTPVTRAASGGRATVGGVVVSPDAAGVTVTPKDQPGVDEATVKGNVSRELDQLAQKMAHGAGYGYEHRQALAVEVEGIAKRAEDAGHPVGELDGLAQKLRDMRPDEQFVNNPQADAHSALVQEVAKIRDEINTSLSPAEPRSPKQVSA